METYLTLAAYLKGTPLTPRSICGRCNLCGLWMPLLEKDHIIPTSDGGSNHISNKQLICGSCHTIKTAKENSLKLTGLKRSPKIRQEMGLSRLGRKPSVETRQKMSKSQTGNTNGLGHTVSAAHRQKLSKTHTGKVVSNETRQKLRKAMKSQTRLHNINGRFF